MRAFLASTAVAVSLLAASAAFAGQAHMATGTVKTYDAKAHAITLSNGKTYALPASLKADDLKPGAKVEVSWVAKGKAHDATSVKVVK